MADSKDNEALFKTGQVIECKILSAEHSGYKTLELKNEITGFLPSENHYEEGDIVQVEFVCWHKEIILLTDRSNSDGKKIGLPV